MKYAHIIDNVVVSIHSSLVGDCDTEIADDIDVNWYFESGEWHPPIPEIPQTITPRQMRLHLWEIGKFADVVNFINSIPDSNQKKAAQIGWEYATMININDPLVDLIIDHLGLNKEEEFLAASLIS